MSDGAMSGAQSPGRLSALERMAILLLGIAEIVAGVVSHVVASDLATTHPSLSTVVSDSGTALLAAGIITSTLEWLSRRRFHQDIESIRQAHLDAVMRLFMPPPIFDQVKAYVISEPFLRSHFDVTMELEWLPYNNAYLTKVQTVHYTVKNISPHRATYTVRVVEEKILVKPKNETSPSRSEVNKDEETTSIDFINYSIGEQHFPQSSSELHTYSSPDSMVLDARVEFPLEPGEHAEVHTQTRSLNYSRDVYYYAVTGPTDTIEVTVAHPLDLRVQALPMHPQDSAFRSTVDGKVVKRWRLEAGLLPFQAIELTWAPKD